MLNPQQYCFGFDDNNDIVKVPVANLQKATLCAFDLMNRLDDKKRPFHTEQHAGAVALQAPIYNVGCSEIDSNPRHQAYARDGAAFTPRTGSHPHPHPPPHPHPHPQPHPHPHPQPHPQPHPYSRITNAMSGKKQAVGALCDSDSGKRVYRHHRSHPLDGSHSTTIQLRFLDVLDFEICDQ